MAIAGDFDLWRVILDYYTVLAHFLAQRTLAYWNHSGVWTTETHTLFGAYLASDYGCSRPPGYPVPLSASGYLHLDGGGDSGTGEWALMALDWYTWTGDATYLPLAFAAADFLSQHYPNRTADGKLVVWPAQVLETYWCDFDTSTHQYTNCCEDDSPTVSAMLALAERLLALPPAVTTAAQRAAWAQWQQLIPALPVAPDNSTVLPARVTSSRPSHNNEGPELYFLHPHRMQTKGRAVATGLDISLGESTLAHSHFAQENSGWNYGLNAAALIGNVAQAAAQVLERARTGASRGYRFDAFADHFQVRACVRACVRARVRAYVRARVRARVRASMHSDALDPPAAHVSATDFFLVLIMHTRRGAARARRASHRGRYCVELQ